MPRTWLFRITAALGGVFVGGCLAGMLCVASRVFGPSVADRAAAAFDDTYQALPMPTQQLLDCAGYRGDQRLALPANFNGALVFSGQVMERHPQRGYRFRPGQTNLWLLPPGMPYQILVPDNTAVQNALGQANITPTASERINAHGCRGPDWQDASNYDFRVLALGDSFTEGILTPDGETFCDRLEAKLRSQSGLSVLVANAGVIGYSTQQEYYTMLELADVVRPHVVVLCFYANDVHHNHHRVLAAGRAGDWDSARQWLDRCATYCRRRSIRFAVAVVPDRSQQASRRSRAFYQHRLERITTELGIYLIDPDERFLSHRREPLYWQGDAHFAVAGHELFAETLADHLLEWMP